MRRLPIHFKLSAQIAIVVLLAVFVGTTHSAEVTRPYEARIVTPGASVLSGPGENYYPTDTLAQGEVVKVYRENADGWLGIRPPQDSFSWVFARHVKRLDNGLAEIEKEDVPSRIGSRLSDQRNAVQIRLKKGEVVEVVGEETTDGQTWYKIAPPSGEFRWIQARNIGRTDQVLASEVAPLESPPPADQPLPPIVTVAATTEGPSSVAAVAQATETQPAAQQEWRAAPADAMPADAVAPQLAGNGTDNASSKTSTTPPETAATNVTPPADSNATSPKPSAPLADGLARRLTDIELQLSRIVAEPPATWQVEPLAREVEQLLAQAQTADERKAVQSTLAKIDRFAAIGRRYRGAPIGAGSGDPRTTPLGQPPNTLGQSPITPVPDTRHLIEDSPWRTPDTSMYDAVGILRPVVSKRAGAPQFALLNERGQVVSFVTPSPDINLQPYVGHRIGVTGSRGYIPEFQRAHVTAGRVAPLNERLLR
jgi:uncharacterized protein YgiM (DUF1202 family)